MGGSADFFLIFLRGNELLAVVPAGQGSSPRDLMACTFSARMRAQYGLFVWLLKNKLNRSHFYVMIKSYYKKKYQPACVSVYKSRKMPFSIVLWLYFVMFFHPF